MFDLLKDLWGFMKERKKFWLAPIILVMVLLGGVQTLSGPLFGAAVFTWLQDSILRLEFWRLILGGAIITLVLVFPQGIGGTFQQLAARLGSGPERGP